MADRFGSLEPDSELFGTPQDLFGSTIDLQEDTGKTFLILPSRTSGDAQNPFDNLPELQEVTAEDLVASFEDSEQLQDTFGSADNYISFVSEMSPLLEELSWTQNVAVQQYEEGSPEWIVANGMADEYSWNPGERERIESEIFNTNRATGSKALTSFWKQPEVTSLLQEYGINPMLANKDGDQFVFTGTGYQKSFKENSPDLANFAKAAFATAAGAFLGPAISSALGGGLTGGAAAGAATDALNQLMLTGTVDLGDMAEAGVISGGMAVVGNLLQGMAPPEGLVDPERIPELEQAIESATISPMDILTSVMGVEDVFNDIGQPVWQPVDVTDVLGDVQVQVPDYSVPQEEEGGGGSEEASGGGGSAGGSGPEVVAEDPGFIGDVDDVLSDEELFGDNVTIPPELTGDESVGDPQVGGQQPEEETPSIVIPDTSSGNIYIPSFCPSGWEDENGVCYPMGASPTGGNSSGQTTGTTGGSGEAPTSSETPSGGSGDGSGVGQGVGTGSGSGSGTGSGQGEGFSFDQPKGMLSGGLEFTPGQASVNYNGMISPLMPMGQRTSYLDELNAILQRSRQR